MSTLKFRAKSVVGNDFWYYANGVYVTDDRAYLIMGDPPHFMPVIKDSICQFIGIDAEGNEVYEKDLLVEQFYFITDYIKRDKTFEASFNDFVGIARHLKVLKKVAE